MIRRRVSDLCLVLAIWALLALLVALEPEPPCPQDETRCTFRPP